MSLAGETLCFSGVMQRNCNYMCRNDGKFLLFSRRSYVGLYLPHLCLFPNITGIVFSSAQWEQANKGWERACFIPAAVMEVKYWWANFKWELCVIIRGLKLKERLLQAAWLFQRELGLRTEKLLPGRRGQRRVNSRNTSWELQEGS